jgi:hypothetical protein
VHPLGFIPRISKRGYSGIVPRSLSLSKYLGHYRDVD